MKRTLATAIAYTVITALFLGIAYPFTILGIGQALFRDKANGQLIISNGHLIGSRILGQPFTGPNYFHSRPSAAGIGYDAQASSGSNLGPTNKTLVDRINRSVANEQTGQPVPIDLVTASASGLDPDITPDAALYQGPRIAQARHLSKSEVNRLIQSHITPRQFGLLGEPRINVLELNLALDQISQN
ncbi:potassium-transporting ATPase subunit KdpC [Granulicella sibirica]|uniref:Potassium-transporting ATPase KdpC subunit n=1 Tax=Granulicella sibirica TaxID=2479048 RepID=A0A4Q0T822_9BACT|nr:potassium-transporting ATPase subunit KdpC [Granulicella sibirica]RXH57856.1 Potassium-transporting ATPase C chain [Granulicella sibirica]